MHSLSPFSSKDLHWYLSMHIDREQTELLFDDFSPRIHWHWRAFFFAWMGLTTVTGFISIFIPMHSIGIQVNPYPMRSLSPSSSKNLHWYLSMHIDREQTELLLDDFSPRIHWHWRAFFIAWMGLTTVTGFISIFILCQTALISKSLEKSAGSSQLDSQVSMLLNDWSLGQPCMQQMDHQSCKWSSSHCKCI